MIKTYKHYGKDVVFQQLQDKQFIDALRENNMKVKIIMMTTSLALLIQKSILHILDRL